MVAPTPALTFAPVKSTWPIALIPIFTKSVLKSVFNTFISWSLVNFSVGVNIRLFTSSFICVEKSPSLSVVKSVFFSKRTALSVVDRTTSSDNWVSNVSGSTIWTR